MTPEEILITLRVPKWHVITQHPAWPSFCAEMKDNQYSYDPLAQAWYFFRRGYEMGDCSNITPKFFHP